MQTTPFTYANESVNVYFFITSQVVSSVSEYNKLIPNVNRCTPGERGKEETTSKIKHWIIMAALICSVCYTTFCTCVGIEVGIEFFLQ